MLQYPFVYLSEGTKKMEGKGEKNWLMAGLVAGRYRKIKRKPGTLLMEKLGERRTFFKKEKSIYSLKKKKKN